MGSILCSAPDMRKITPKLTFFCDICSIFVFFPQEITNSLSPGTGAEREHVHYVKHTVSHIRASGNHVKYEGFYACVSGKHVNSPGFLSFCVRKYGKRCVTSKARGLGNHAKHMVSYEGVIGNHVKHMVS